MARERTKRDDDLAIPPLASTIFVGEDAAVTLAQQGITGPANAIALARRLRAEGASRAEIHRQTSKMLEGTPYAGVHFGPKDGKPRFEISDEGARFKPGGMPVLSKAPIADVLEHPELYKAVPSVGMTRIERSTTNDSSYDGRDIAIGKKHVKRSGARQTFEPGAMGPALHELQHDIQGKHRLNGGGSPDDFPGLPRDMQIQLYRSIDGENEAEMTRAREKKTAAERRATPPEPNVAWRDQISVTDELADARRQKFLGGIADAATDAWKRMTTREVVDGRPVHQRRLDPRKVKADPDTFQFKSGGDSAGVTDRLKGVKTWDPLAAGKQIVYQRANGEHVIADGHQRRGLALRAIEGGQKGVALDAYVLRETDGWSPRDVRAYAALKNIKESSGNPLDMAKVMRERPDLVAKSLPMSDAKIRDAVALSKLSPKAFDMVASGAVKAEHAAAVGAHVGDTGRHADLLTEMHKAGMRSAEHARLYVQQAMAAPSITENQASLFGNETKVRSLLAERAKVLDRALGQLKSDKKIFSLLQREASNIEAVGNRLAHQSNLDQADHAGRLAQLVERLSTTRGPVSAMLDKAALALAEGKPAAQAARSFVGEVGKAMKAGGINALTGDAGVPVQAPVADPNQGDIFGERKPAGWNDDARKASANKRKGRKQMMVEDGSSKPSKTIDPNFAKGQFVLHDAGRSLAYSNGWKAAKDGRRLASGVDPDFAAGYQQYKLDKSPRAAERAMIQHLAKGGGVMDLSGKAVTLGGTTMPENAKPMGQSSKGNWYRDLWKIAGERGVPSAIKALDGLSTADVIASAKAYVAGFKAGKNVTRDQAVKALADELTISFRENRLFTEIEPSFLPEPTTKEKVAAAARAKGKPTVAQHPMDDGMFGSSRHQTDLVDAIKAKPPETKMPKMSTRALNEAKRQADMYARLARMGTPTADARTLAGLAKDQVIKATQHSRKQPAWVARTLAEIDRRLAAGEPIAPPKATSSKPKSNGDLARSVSATSMAAKRGEVPRAAFDPYASKLIPTAQRGGIDGIVKTLQAMSGEHAVAALKAQTGVTVRPGATDAETRAKVAKAAFDTMSQRSAAAGSDSLRAKWEGMGRDAAARLSAPAAEPTTPGLRGTQNAANRDAIVKNRKAAAKGSLPAIRKDPYGGSGNDIGSVAAQIKAEKTAARKSAKLAKAVVDAARTNEALEGIRKALGKRPESLGKPAAAVEKPKDLPRAAAIKRFSELMNGPPNGPWTTREINRAIRSEEKRLSGKSSPASWSSSMSAKAEEPHAITTKPPRKSMMIDDGGHAPIDPRSLHGRQAPGFNQVMDRLIKQADAPTPTAPATPKPSLTARAGHAFNVAGTAGIGVGIASAAVIAANDAARAGASGGQQAAAAATAAAVAAAPAVVVGGGMAAAAKFGGATAAKLIPGVGWAIAGVAAAHGAISEGMKASKDGKGALGIARAAGWGAINSVVPIDAAVAAAASTRARVSGDTPPAESPRAPGSIRAALDRTMPGPVRLDASQATRFAAANSAFQRMQAHNTTQTDIPARSERKPGWGPEARIAAAKVRGAALPYSGDPSKAPGYRPPVTVKPAA